MNSRLRQRPVPHTAAGPSSSSSLPLRPPTSRVTRHASITNYAEPSESEDEDDYDDDEEDGQDERNQNTDDSDDPLAESDSDHGDDESGDGNFTSRQRPSKRPRLNDRPTTMTEFMTGRRQLRRRSTAGSNPSSDEARQRRREARAAAASRGNPAPSAESTPSPQKKRRDRNGPRRGRSESYAARHELRSQVKRPPSPPRTNQPPWATLPYFILSTIFSYASAPLDTVASVRWLLASSRTCKGFTEPALRALYESPPMLTMNMAHNLVDHMAKDPSTTTFDYRQKVRTLRIDIGSLATRVYKGRHLDIAKLVSCCPRLVNLDLYHYKDMPPYREQTENLRWTYPRELFEALGAVPPAGSNGTAENNGVTEANGGDSSVHSLERYTVDSLPQLIPLSKASAPTVIKLKSWRWNQRLMGRELDLDAVRTLHLSPTFSGLRKISFVNYQRPSLNARDAESPEMVEADRQQAEHFAGLLNALPDLRHLVVESSTAANDLILPLMPKKLQYLEMINCWDVSADKFAEYLVTHGHELRELTLNYNQSLSLSFLPVLGTACPQLQALRMNLTYYSQHAFYNDANPTYTCLMTPDQVPTWPEGIRVIELEHLRKWEPDAAEVFFQSLVDSAPHMPQLRVLALKAMMDVPWRQRCAIRDKWVATFDRVFKRRSSPPEPARSLSYYAKQKKALKKEKSTSSPQSKGKARLSDLEPSRRSGRIATHASSPSSRASSTARGLRNTVPSGRVSYREPDTDEDIPSEQSDQEDTKKKEKAKESESETDKMDVSGDERPSTSSSSSSKSNTPFVHGMCDVVDIRMDNQKLGEVQFRMDDFLDSDDDGSDGEWTGDGAEANDYAW